MLQKERSIVSDIDRFMSKVVIQPNGCWEWQGVKDHRSYGVLSGDLGKQFKKAHRWSYWYHKGHPGDMFVCHSCDNPSCVNPEHLWLGTHQDNNNDRILKDRSIKGEKHGNAKLTDEDVKDIKYSTVDALTISKKYNITRQTVYLIRWNKAWKHI